MNIYLDIDGVLLANDNNKAFYAEDFLKYVLARYPETTYWLTTHCQGDPMTPIEHVGHLFSPEVIELMKKIKPTTWDINKTDGIDFTKPFLWFDDDLFSGEKEVLKKQGVLDNWIEVDLRKNVNQLKTFLESFPIPVQILTDTKG